MRCICYTIVLCIVIQPSTLGAAGASVQESVSNPTVAFLLSYLAAWNLRSGLDLRGRQAGTATKTSADSLFVHFAYLSAPHVAFRLWA